MSIDEVRELAARLHMDSDGGYCRCQFGEACGVHLVRGPYSSHEDRRYHITLAAARHLGYDEDRAHELATGYGIGETMTLDNEGRQFAAVIAEQADCSACNGIHEVNYAGERIPVCALCARDAFRRV